MGGELETLGSLVLYHSSFSLTALLGLSLREEKQDTFNRFPSLIVIVQ